MIVRDHIRNFTIIAHIDHGKSTLADRLLEVTGTIEKRRMQEQVLDSMELERERGITIKMQPVRMACEHDGTSYVLNLIDTPGHIDFSYEVSRALKAVEGALLLVDATQGVQAQTLSVLRMAEEAGLTIIPVVTKVDAPHARVDDVVGQVAELLHRDHSEILRVSGKTGEGVEALLRTIVARIPAPQPEFPETPGLRAIVFDFEYSIHRGIILYVRVLDGMLAKGAPLLLAASKETAHAQEIGVFTPDFVSKESLSAGEIGYIVTGLKNVQRATVGDSVLSPKVSLPAIAGYTIPRPVVWASVYPESQDDFALLKGALGKLQLTDPALSFEEESSGLLGRGFRCGFLGMLHLEIVVERLKREHNVALVVATPSITYEIEYKGGKRELVYSPIHFPDYNAYERVREPWAKVEIITPSDTIGPMTRLLHDHEGILGETTTFGDGRVQMHIEIPLRELMRGFFDRLKSVSAGYASLSYEITDMRDADVVRLDILIADEVQAPFTRVVSRRRAEEEARAAVERLKNILPRQQFVMKIQGKALGRIVASETVSAFRKDVLSKGGKTVGGGDVSRKKKLLEKQKRGKSRMKAEGKLHIPQDVFLDMMRSEE